MYHLRDAYDSESAPTIATGVLAVGISLMFTVGLFLIISAHSNSQSQQLAQAVAAIRKSQTEGIDLNTALAQVKAASATDKNKSATPAVPSGPVNGNFDTITVKGTSALQGNVKVDRDVSIGGKLNAKGDLQVGGAITKDGVDTDNLYIQNASADPTTGTAVAVDDITTTTLSADEATLASASLGSASVDDTLTVGGDVTVDGDVTGASLKGNDLTVDGLVDAESLTVSGDASIEGALTVGDAVTLQDDLTVAGDTTLTGNLAVGGTLTIGGADINTLFIQNATPSGTPSIDIQGDISAANLGLSGNLTLDGNLSITAGHIIGNDDTKGTETVASGDSSVHHDFATPYSTAPVVVVSPVTQAVTYKVTSTTTGFDITLSGPAGADLDFNYLVQE